MPCTWAPKCPIRTGAGTSSGRATGTRSDLDPQLDNPVPNVRPWRQFFRGDIAQADFLAVSIERDSSTPDAPTPDQIVALAEVPPA